MPIGGFSNCAGWDGSPASEDHGSQYAAGVEPWCACFKQSLNFGWERPCSERACKIAMNFHVAAEPGRPFKNFAMKRRRSWRLSAREASQQQQGVHIQARDQRGLACSSDIKDSRLPGAVRAAAWHADGAWIAAAAASGALFHSIRGRFLTSGRAKIHVGRAILDGTI
jgi:hypothetical protein